MSEDSAGAVTTEGVGAADITEEVTELRAATTDQAMEEAATTEEAMAEQDIMAEVDTTEEWGVEAAAAAQNTMEDKRARESIILAEARSKL